MEKVLSVASRRFGMKSAFGCGVLRVLVALDICAYVISNLINYFAASILEYFIRLRELHALTIRVGKLDVAQIGEA